MKKLILLIGLLFFVANSYSQSHTFKNVYVESKGLSDITISKTDSGYYKISFKEPGWPNPYWEYVVRYDKFEDNIYIYQQVSNIMGLAGYDLSSGKGYTPPGLLTPVKLSEVATGKGTKIKMNMLNVDYSVYTITLDCK